MDRGLAEKIVERLQRRGADKSAVRLLQIRQNELNADKNEISLFRTTVDNGLYMKIIKDNKMGSCQINNLNEENLSDGIDTVFEAMEASSPDPAYDIAEFDGSPHHFNAPKNPLDKDRMVKKLNNLLKYCEKQFPAVILSNTSLCHKEIEIKYNNSNGVDNYQGFNFFSIILMFTAKERERSSSFNYTHKTFNVLKKDQELYDIPGFNRLLKQISEQINCRPVPEKFEGDIIISPECALYLTYMLIKPLFQEQIISKTSIFLNKLDKAVASPVFTLKSLPLSPDFAVNNYLQDDGYLNEDMTIIENGILRTFLLTKYGENKTGFKRSKNMGEALCIVPGETPFENMVKSCKKGVLLCRFSGEYPSDAGDFSGIAKNSYYIEDGKIKWPLSETMISGNTAEMLKNITEISSDFVNNGSNKMPYLKIRGLLISQGQKEEKAPELSYVFS